MHTTYCPQCASPKNYRHSSCGTVQRCTACGYKFEMPYQSRAVNFRLSKRDAKGLGVLILVGAAIILSPCCCALGLIGDRSSPVPKHVAANKAAKGHRLDGPPEPPQDNEAVRKALDRIKKQEEESAAKLKVDREAEERRLAEKAIRDAEEAKKTAEALSLKNEAAAAAKLKIARRFLEENSNKEMARKKASEVIEQFPDTKAAGEAKIFLDGLGK